MKSLNAVLESTEVNDLIKNHYFDQVTVILSGG